MAKLRATLSRLQNDDVLFSEFSEKVKHFGAVALAQKGKVTEPTIRKFLARQPVDIASEQAIVDSYELCLNDEIAKSTANVDRVKELLRKHDGLVAETIRQ